MEGRNEVIVPDRQIEVHEITCTLESETKGHENAVKSPGDQGEDHESVWESETEDHEQHPVLPFIETDFSLSPSLEQASNTCPVQKRIDSGFVLESDLEDSKDGFIQLQAIEIYSAPLLPVVNNFSSRSKSLKLITVSPHSSVHCSKRVFKAVKFNNNKPIAMIKLAIVGDWSGCAMTTVIFGTDCFNHYYCPFPDCNKKFRKKYNIRAHLALFHHGPFYCPREECGKSFNSKVSKLRHVRKNGHGGQCCIVPIESYHTKQIQDYCFSMCQKIENAPDFWMM